MKVTFDSFDEFADWVYKKKLHMDELQEQNYRLESQRLHWKGKNENLQAYIDELEMDRLRDSDRIAELEHELYTLKNDNGFLQHDCVPNLLRHTDQKIKKSPATTDDD